MMTLILFCMSIVLAQEKTAGSGAVEWPISAGGNGHYYEAVLVPEGISWDDAEAAAEAKGGHLVTITSEAENEFVYNLVAGDDRYWFVSSSSNNGIGPLLGGYQPEGSPEPAGGWTWITGEPFSYTNWATGTPDNFEGENRLDFLGSKTLKSPGWNDLPHDWSGPKGYIVEWDAELEA
ncbi:MAG: lectin-like protein [Methanothrix sp.]|nr:lectin-like protein [Methanothrix sp.]